MQQWFSVTEHHFQYWADKSGIPWCVIKPHIADSMEKARTLWPTALQSLPMDEQHKKKLQSHWLKLEADFKIES